MTIITQNSRIKRYVATENQTVFAYDWLIYNGTDIKVLKNGTSLKYGTDYNVTVGNGGSVTLITGAARDDSIIIYSGTPETRTTDFNGGAVNVDAANVAIDNLTMQTQQLRRDIDSCVRNSIIDGEMSELPPKNERSNMFAKYDSEGNLSYANEVDFLKPGKNLSDVNNKEQAFNNISPLTEKGDILCYNGENNIRLSAGNSGQVLKLDENRMPFWGTDKDTSDTALIQKGDLLTRTDSSVTRLGIGTTGQVLTVGSSSFPEWKTLNQGTMSSQNASAVAITGGTIRGTTISSNTIQNSNITGGSMSGVAVTGGTVSGLTTPLPVASGGTGLNALGTAGHGLITTHGNTTVWSPMDCLNIANTQQILNASLNNYSTPGSFEVTGTNVTNRPTTATANATANLVVRRIHAHVWQDYYDIFGGKHFYRSSQDGGSTWSEWAGENDYCYLSYLSTDGKNGTNSFPVQANTKTALPFLYTTPSKNPICTLTWNQNGSIIKFKKTGHYFLDFNFAVLGTAANFRWTTCIVSTTSLNSNYLYSVCQTNTVNNTLSYINDSKIVYLKKDNEMSIYIQPTYAITMYGGSTVYTTFNIIRIGD